jgi:sortase B
LLDNNSDSNKKQNAPRGAHAKIDNTQTKKDADAKKTKSKILLIIAIVLIIAALAVAGFMLKSCMDMNKAAEVQNSTPTPQTTVESSSSSSTAEVALPDNPIDFATQQAQNADIYAWIYIPNTNINLPVLQSTISDNYYLDHDINGASSVAGAIYSQSANAKDFSDPVTLLYGHNLLNSTMFTQLHYFEDATFFANNPTFYIYTPGHILTYEVVAAYQYDDRHILNSFDFSNPTVVQNYFNTVLSPTSLLVNVREGATLDASTDTIVQLSTCMDGAYSSTSRYIVTGKLIDDQATN